MSDFYRQLTPEELALAQRGLFNFDDPDAFDFELLESVINGLALGQPVTLPSFDFKNHTRCKNAKDIGC